MSLLDKLKNFWIKKPTENSSDDDNNKLIISLNPDHNNEPFIKIIISDTTDSCSKKFGEMLFNINSGLYYKSIVDLLTNMSKEDAEIKKFVELSMIYWASLVKDEARISGNLKWENQDKPLIQPMDFNKNAR